MRDRASGRNDGLGQTLAHLPEARRLRAGGGNQRVAHHARSLVPAASASARGSCREPGGPWLVTSMSTYQRWGACIGSSCPGTPASRKSMSERRISSKAETASPRRVRTRPSSATAAAGDSTRDPRGLARRRLGEQAQHRGRDDAQRAFGADEELLHVVAGVVLAQAPQPVPDAPVRQHHLEAQHQVAHGAVAQHLHAAGVGRDVAANLAGALGAEAQREQPVGAVGGVLDLLQDHAGFDGDGVVDRVDGADALEPRGGDDDLAHVLVRLAAAGQSCVAALGDDGDAALGTDVYDACDLLGRLRPQYQGDAAHPVVAPARAVGRDVGGVVEIAGAPHHGLQSLDGLGRDRIARCTHRSSPRLPRAVPNGRELSRAAMLGPKRAS